MNRFKKRRLLDIRNEAMFKPELQEAFLHADMMGFLKLMKPGYLTTRMEFYMMILTNIGLLALDVQKFEPKHFFPLKGVKITDHQTSKGKVMPAIAVNWKGFVDPEIIVFGSKFEKQEWVTKIQKVNQA